MAGVRRSTRGRLHASTRTAKSGVPATKTTPRHPPDDRTILKDDIIVTAIARHFAVGHMTADGKTQTSVEWQANLGKALERACLLAGTKHRVFIYANPGGPAYRIFACPPASS